MFSLRGFIVSGLTYRSLTMLSSFLSMELKHSIRYVSSECQLLKTLLFILQFPNLNCIIHILPFKFISRHKIE